MSTTTWTICVVVSLIMLLPASLAVAGSVSAAKSRVTEARENLDRGWTDRAEDSLKTAEKFLDGLTDAEKAPILADINAVRAQIAARPTPEQERSIRAAQMQLKSARSKLDDGQPALAEAAVAGTERYLAVLTPEQKAPLVAEMKMLRDQIAAKTGAPAATPRPAAPDDRATGAKPATPAPAAGQPAMPAKPSTAAPTAAAPAAPAAAGGMTAEQAANLQRAREKLAEATQQVDAGDNSNLSSLLFRVESYSRELPEAEKAALKAESTALKARAEQMAEVAERTSRITREFERHLRNADENAASDARLASISIDHITKRLTEDEVKQTLTPAKVREYEAILAGAKKKMAAANRAEALGRADDSMKKIEEMLAEDPFKGKDEREAYSAHSSMESWKKSVVAWLGDLPADDEGVKAMRTRLATADAKIDKFSTDWGKAALDAQVGSGWEWIKKDIDGWERETVDPKAQPLDSPNLPKTRAAINRITYWLDSDETKKIRGENKADPTLNAMYAEGERVRAAAAEKLAAAYNAVFDRAEKMETPMRRFELDRPSLLAYDAEAQLAGTKQQADVVARARKLDEKWKSEVAAIMKSRQELYDKLAAEGDKTWPGIVATLKPLEAFDPGDASLKGKTVILKGVYNRSRWDFGDYDFAVRMNGVPVGATYEPHVVKALEHAWYELKLDVNDRIPWDVVAVVDGPGQIGQRTTITLKDRDTNLEIGKLEEFRPVPCMRMRVIALHAGPVAVGPGK